jgi:hypothetical protein
MISYLDVAASPHVGPPGARNEVAVSQLSVEERLVIKAVSEFVDREVRPVVRDLEHNNTHPRS